MLRTAFGRVAAIGTMFALVCASFLVAATPARAITRPVHALVTMLSTPGDFIGQGIPRFFSSPGNATITSYGGIYGIAVDVSGGTSGDSYSLTFAAPRGKTLAPGLYADAQRTPFRTGKHPGIDISGSGRGCNVVSGSFDIQSMVHRPKGLTSLSMTYVQHCEAGTASLFGQIRIGAAATQDVVTSESKVWWPEVLVGASDPTIPIWVQNNGSGDISVGSSMVTGVAASDFPMGTDACSGVVLSPGDLCQVFVAFQPQHAGPRAAELVVPVDGTDHRIQLTGTAWGGATYLDLQSGPDDPIGQGNTYAWDPGNASFIFWGSLTRFAIGANDGTTEIGGTMSPPTGEELTTKTYTGAVKDGQNGSAPGLNIGTSYSCETVSGSFTIDQIAADPASGDLRSVAGEFTQYCDGNSDALNGQFAYRAPQGDITPPAPISHLHVVRHGSSAGVTWTNPGDGDLAFVVVRDHSGSRPIGDPNAGRFAFTGVGTSAAITGVPGGAPFTIELWTVDVAGNVGTPVIYTSP